MNRIESVPTVWDDTRDGCFFRVVLHALEPGFERWASSMLAANDNELTEA